CMHVYNKRRVEYIGDRILVVIRGEKKKNNNLVLVDNGTSLDVGVYSPDISHDRCIFQTKMKKKTHSKGANYTKLIPIASRFVVYLSC
ncbi:hypothetical protein ALC53_09150, partial [Atta colombica]